jgi:hypothetical protein
MVLMAGVRRSGKIIGIIRDGESDKVSLIKEDKRV